MSKLIIFNLLSSIVSFSQLSFLKSVAILTLIFNLTLIIHELAHYITAIKKRVPVISVNFGFTKELAEVYPEYKEIISKLPEVRVGKYRFSLIPLWGWGGVKIDPNSPVKDKISVFKAGGVINLIILVILLPVILLQPYHPFLFIFAFTNLVSGLNLLPFWGDGKEIKNLSLMTQ